MTWILMLVGSDLFLVIDDRERLASGESERMLSKSYLHSGAVLSVICAVLLFSESSYAADDGLTADAGTIEARARFLDVHPEVSDSSVSIGGHVTAGDSIEPEVDGTYFFTPNIAAELIAAVTQHEPGVVLSNGTKVPLGRVLLLPPTLTAQYHFGDGGRVDPYVGAGINYTFFFDHKLPGNSGLGPITYENHVGFALQAGMDIQVSGPWVINIDIKQIFLHTNVKLANGAVTAKVDLDPTIFGIGIGYRF